MDMETEVTLCPTPSMENCSWLLVDVAGTTTSIDYVKDTLYPLVYSEITNYLKSRANQPELQRALKNLGESRELDAEAAGELVKSLTRQDSDNEDLKTIQGYLYRHFYDNGELEGHVFDDVREAFEKWATTRRIAIFSSSSVETQKLHFSNSACGNLTPHISKYFDLKMGSKVDAGTYDKITRYLGVKPEEVVYLTDCPREAAAARSAGLGAFIVIREGNAELPKEALRDFPAISSFCDLPLDKAAKRKIEETSGSEEPPSKVTKVEDLEESKSEDSNKPQESMEVDASNEINAEKAELPEDKEKTDIVIDDKSEVATDDKTDMEVKTCNEPVEVKPTKEASVEKDKVEEEVNAESKKEDGKEQVASNGEQESTEAKLVSDDVQTETETKTDDKTEDVQEEVKSADEVKKSDDAKNVDEAKNTDEIKNADETKNGDVIEQENPDAAKNGESMEQENADVAKKGESIEQENPDAAKNGESIEQENADEAKKGESVEKEKSDTTKSVELVEQENGNEVQKPEKTVATASEVSEEQAETSSETKTDEKENKSDLANVIENGNKLDETENNSESKEHEEETKTDDVAQEPEDADVKVKKLEETTESKTVSVEV